jgi:inner membrane protease subunit 2
MAKIRSSNQPIPSTTPPPASASAPASAAANPSPSLPQTQTQTPTQSPPRPNRPSLSSLFRNRYATLPTPIRRTFRVLRILAPIVPIGIFFSEHVLQVMWVRGPSMTPFLNEDYEAMHTKSDMVLVNMWPFGGAGWPWERKRRLERGMVVTFRWVACSTSTLFLTLLLRIWSRNMLTGMVVLGRRLIPNTPLSSGLSVFPVIGSRLGNRV